MSCVPGPSCQVSSTQGSDQPRADFQADGICQIPVTKCSGRCLETVGDIRAVATIFFQALYWFWIGYYIQAFTKIEDLQEFVLCQFVLCDSEIEENPGEQKVLTYSFYFLN